MMLEMSAPEAEFLRELLEVVNRDRLRELSHTDSLDYKRILEDRLALLDSLLAKLSPQDAGR